MIWTYTLRRCEVEYGTVEADTEEEARLAIEEGDTEIDGLKDDGSRVLELAPTTQPAVNARSDSTTEGG